MKYLTGILALSFVFSFAPNTFALESDVNAEVDAEVKLELNNERPQRTRDDNSEERMKKEEERRLQMENRRGEMQEKKDSRILEHRENAKLRIGRHIEWMTKRFNAAVERLEKLVLRIESRIEKLDEEDKDTSEAKSLVVKAKVSIESAKSGIADIPETVEDAVSKEELKGAFTELRTLVESIRADLKEAHRLLIEAVTKLKGLRVGVESSTNVEVGVE